MQTSCFLFLDYYVLIISAYANWTLKEKVSSEKMCAVRNDRVGEVHQSKNKARFCNKLHPSSFIYMYVVFPALFQCAWFMFP